MPARKLAAASRSASDLYLGRDNLIQLGEALLDPAIMGLVIWTLSILYEGEITPPYFILSVLVLGAGPEVVSVLGRDATASAPMACR